MKNDRRNLNPKRSFEVKSLKDQSPIKRAEEVRRDSQRSLSRACKHARCCDTGLETSSLLQILLQAYPPETRCPVLSSLLRAADRADSRINVTLPLTRDETINNKPTNTNSPASRTLGRAELCNGGGSVTVFFSSGAAVVRASVAVAH